MREDRLLDRIRSWEREPLQRGRFDPQKAVDSVIRHLQKLLNTHQGSVLIASDYGIPDFSYMLQSGADSATDVENTIRDVIEKYEPRLTGVRVRYAGPDDDLFALHFQIQAKLKTDAKAVLFETVVSPDGKIKVK